MAPLNVNLKDLIDQIDADLPDADLLGKISEAQQRSHLLSGIGDTLVDHFVAQARQVGLSWTQIGAALGVTKQAAQQRWVPAMFARFTDRARHVVVLAQEKARELRHDCIGPEHLLLGMLAEGGGIGAAMLAAMAGPNQDIEAAVRQGLTPGSQSPPAQLGFTEPGTAVLVGAGDQAAGLGHTYVGTEHLLLALVHASDPIAGSVLASRGIQYAEVRAQLPAFLAAHSAAGQAVVSTSE
jgi:hypothetical protein